MRVRTVFSLVVLISMMSGCGSSVSGDQTESDSSAAVTTLDSSATEPTRESSTTGSTENASEQRFASSVEITQLQSPTTAVGFGFNSLWTVDLGGYKCADTGSEMGGAGGQAAAGSCLAPEKVFLRRVSPEADEVSGAIPLKGSEVTDIAFGDESAWIGVNYPGPSSGALFELSSKTSKILDRSPVASPAGVAFGEGSVWVTSGDRGTLLRLDPRTGEATANIKVSGGGTNAVALGEGAVWVASWGTPSGSNGQDRFGGKEVVRVDPETNGVAAEIPVEENALEGGASSVTVDKETGAVWATSVNGKLFRLDPETNQTVAEVKLGDYAWEVETFAGDVWVIYETGVYDPSQKATQRVARIDADNNKVIGSREAKNASGLAAGQNALWLTTSSMENGAGTLTRIIP